MMLLNARSIRNKLLEFRCLVATESVDIICITETWLRTDERDFTEEYHIPGYVMYLRDRGQRAGGGVMIYARSHLHTVLRTNDLPHEVIGIELRELGQTLHLYLVYRPPHQTVDCDRDLYGSLSDILQDKTAIVLGDFNCRVDWNLEISQGEGNRLLDFKNENFLTQMVRSPTRGDNTLDLIFTTDEDLVSQVTVGECLGTSDHHVISFVVGCRVHQESVEFKNRLNLRRADYESFARELRDLPPQLPGSTEEMWQGFKANYISIQSRCIPLKRVGGSSKVNPKWFHDGIGRAIRRRKLLYIDVNADPTPEKSRRLTVQRRLVKKLVRTAKVAEEHRVALACKGNPKEFFTFVNSRKPATTNVGPIRNSRGDVITSDAGIAEELNRYFVSVFTQEDAVALPEPVIVSDGRRTLTEIRCTIEEVAAKIGNLDPSKAAGSDGYLPKVMRNVRDGLAPHLHQIFTVSLDSGVAPEDMKIADVAPIFKAGEKFLCSNYRPISLTSVPGKVLESIIKDRIVCHLEQEELMGGSQHGFLRGRSCLTNLLDFFYYVFKEHDRSRAVDIVYLDFRKAFDKVPHQRLLLKVRALGIGGGVLNWIKSWLSGRRQRVVIKGAASEWAPVTSGVPQGSVLGPLLFIIYINDIDVGIVSRLSKFADDTKLGINASDPVAVGHLQRDLLRIGDWSEKWLMPFNVEKCAVLHVGSRNAGAQ